MILLCLVQFCQNFDISMYFKKFPLALQTIFSLHNFEADNFFQPTTVCEQYFYEKGNPLIKNNGPSLICLRTTVPFATVHLEIFHCMYHPVIPKSDLYFTFCSTLNALSKRTSK